MLPQVLALHGVVPGERESADESVQDLLTQSGWILESKELSENDTCIVFEIPCGNLEWFGGALPDTGLQLDEESRKVLEGATGAVAELPEEDQGQNMRGTLEMTFLQPRKPPAVEEEEASESTEEEQGDERPIEDDEGTG